MVSFMLSVGLSQGVAPLIGYCYGAGQSRRMAGTMRLSMLYGCLLGGLFVVCFLTLGKQLAALFLREQALIEQTAYFLTILCLSAPTLGVINMVTSYFRPGQGGVFLGYHGYAHRGALHSCGDPAQLPMGIGWRHWGPAGGGSDPDHRLSGPIWQGAARRQEADKGTRCGLKLRPLRDGPKGGAFEKTPRPFGFFWGKP